MAYKIASYRLTAAGYDATNTRLLDESGLNNHLPLLAGAPDFTGSYGGKTCFKMHGTAYFGGPNHLGALRVEIYSGDFALEDPAG